MGVGPSMVHTLPSALDVVSGPSEVCTLPRCLRCEVSAPTPPWEHRVTGCRGGWSCCCRRIPQTAPECLFFFFFFFLRNSSCSILLPHTRKGLSSHRPTSPARPGTVRVRAWHRTSLKSPLQVYMVSVGLPLRPYSPPCNYQATRYLSVLLKPCLAGQGAVNLALSQESCGRPGGRRPGAVVTLVPALVRGTFLSFCFFSVLYTFWSPIFINTGVLLLFALFLSILASCFTCVQGEHHRVSKKSLCLLCYLDIRKHRQCITLYFCHKIKINHFMEYLQYSGDYSKSCDWNTTLLF